MAEKKIYFEDLGDESAKEHFEAFVRRWNAGVLAGTRKGKGGGGYF